MEDDSEATWKVARKLLRGKFVEYKKVGEGERSRIGYALSLTSSRCSSLLSSASMKS